jgi:hypothetical protein
VTKMGSPSSSEHNHNWEAVHFLALMADLPN